MDYLDSTNETDYQQGRISYETYARVAHILERCRECELCGNGKFGDMVSECRMHVKRIFASMKRDIDDVMQAKRQAGAAVPATGALASAVAAVSATGVDEAARAPASPDGLLEPLIIAGEPLPAVIDAVQIASKTS